MKIKTRCAVGVGAGILALVSMGGAASAGHAHFVVIENPATGTTTCQYIGSGQTSISDHDHGGYHKIHDNVHTGRPGTDSRGTAFDKQSNQANYDCDIVRQP